VTTTPSLGGPGAPGTLDDRTYADLVTEARALLPALHPAWTDHNPSDPGVTLVELFAWLTEILVYRVDQVPTQHTWAFLGLLNGPGWTPPEPGERTGARLADEIAATTRELQRLQRAVTAEDVEHLLAHEWPGSDEAAALGEPGRSAVLRRARCVPLRDLTRTGADADEAAPAHVSVVVVPEPVDGDPAPAPSAELLAAIAAFLEPRRLLTTRLHVVGPRYANVTVAARLALRADAPADAALAAATDALRARLDPFRGGADGRGRPLGDDVHAGEIYALLDAVPLVDHVEDVVLTGPNTVLDEDDTVTSVVLAADELVRLTAIDLRAYDTYGEHRATWQVTA